MSGRDEMNHELIFIDELLRPTARQLAYQITKHLKVLVKSSQNKVYIERALRASDVIITCLDLTYHDYRVFIGNLNHVRKRQHNLSWAELIIHLRELTPQMSSTSGVELAHLLVGLAQEELERSQERSSSASDLEGSFTHLTCISLIEDLLLMSRALYPLGVNVIQPEWSILGANESHFTLDHPSEVKLSSNTSIIISRDPRQRRCAQIQIVYEGDSPLKDNARDSARDKSRDKSRDQAEHRVDDQESAHRDEYTRREITTATLGPNSTLCIGRGYIKSRSFLGFPVSLRIDSELQVDDSLCSRAALLCVLDHQGRVFLLDRASRNRVKCVTQSQRDASHSMVYRYTPEVTHSQVPNSQLKSSQLFGPQSSNAQLSSARLLDSVQLPERHQGSQNPFAVSPIGATSAHGAAKPHTLIYSFGRVAREEIKVTGVSEVICGAPNAETRDKQEPVE